MRGRISITWEEIINNHLTSNMITNITAEQWGEQLIQINWRYILQMWYVRNEAIRETTKEEQNAKRKHQMMEEFKYIQGEYSDMPSSDRRFINIKESQMENMSANHLASYIAGARILANYNKKNRVANRRYQKIIQFFKPIKCHDKKCKEDKSELEPGE
jgi:hypothetical protein